MSDQRTGARTGVLKTVAAPPSAASTAQDPYESGAGPRVSRLTSGPGRRSLRRRTAGLVAVIRPAVAVGFLIFVFLAAAFPSLFTSQDPIVGKPSQVLLGPSWHHLFGTDNLGRDEWARAIYGTRPSVLAGVAAVVIALIVGGGLGLVAGKSGRIADAVIMRVMDVLLSVPSLLISLALITAIGFSSTRVALAVAMPAVGAFARLTRSQVLQISQDQYVEAAAISGSGPAYILVRHVLPNALSPVLAYGVLDFGEAVLTISALSFLGFGAQPPNPEWGSLISDGHNYLATAWWLTTLTGLLVVGTVLSATTIARGTEAGKRVPRRRSLRSI